MPCGASFTASLQTKSQTRPNDIQVAGDADAVVLSQVIHVLGEVVVKNLGPTHIKTVAHPTIHRPVVKNLVGDEQ